MPVTQRPPIHAPFYVKLSNALGGFWDVFPWLGVAFELGGFWMRWGNPPLIAVIIILVAWLAWLPFYIFWLICDVLATRSPWWWAIIALLCYPFGLLAYWNSGRGG